MTFSVNLEAVAGLADLVERRSRDLDAARRYLYLASGLPGGPGLLRTLSESHHRAVDELGAFLRTVADGPVAGQADRIRDAIARYQRDVAPATADRALLRPRGAPPPTTVAADPSLRADLFGDVARPRARFTDPPSHRARFTHSSAFVELLTPSAHTRDLVWEVTGLASRVGLLRRPYDPFDHFVEPFAGEWATVYRCGDVLDNVAAGLADVATSLGEAAERRLPQVWTGNAAATCVANLLALARHLALAEAPVTRLAARYRRCAETVHAVGELAAGVAGELMDRCVWLLLAVASRGAPDAAALVAELRAVAVVVGRAVAFRERGRAAVRTHRAWCDAFTVGPGGAVRPRLSS